jgi:hypothetical protein
MAAPVINGESFDMGPTVSLFDFGSGTTLVLVAPYAVLEPE